MNLFLVKESTQNTTVTKSVAYASYKTHDQSNYVTLIYTMICFVHAAAYRRLSGVGMQGNFMTGQNEREETTQNTTVTKSAACASYKIKATVGYMQSMCGFCVQLAASIMKACWSKQFDHKLILKRESAGMHTEAEA